MTRERELAKIEEDAGYITSFAWPGKQLTFRENVCNAIEAACRLGERLGREDSDSVYWPALCEQWRIEFGRELGQQGGHIMNIVDGVRELLSEEREECAKAIVAVRTKNQNDVSGRIAEPILEECEAAIRARGVGEPQEQK